MATPLNRALDAVEWPPFQQLLTPVMTARYPRELIINNALHVFEELLLQHGNSLHHGARVGWKVPDTFHWLEEFSGFFDDFQYVHLVRNGLDMAYSSNKNQIKNWASAISLAIEYSANGNIQPRSMLEYWLTANERALATADRCMHGNILVLRFEQLCLNPTRELRRLLEFLHIDCSDEQVAQMTAMVRTPGSVGRYLQFNWKADFSTNQLDRLARLGYLP
jgi:hypothetical protein